MHSFFLLNNKILKIYFFFLNPKTIYYKIQTSLSLFNENCKIKYLINKKRKMFVYLFLTIFAFTTKSTDLINIQDDLCDLCDCSMSSVFCSRFKNGLFNEINGLFKRNHFIDYENEIKILTMNYENTYHKLEMEHNTLKNMVKLNQLDIRGIKLRWTLNLANVANLKQIVIQHASLKFIEGNFCENKYQLFKIDLSYNSIELVNNVFSECTNLLVLDLSHNRLRSAHDISKTLTGIKILNLKNNFIEVINESDLKNLVELDKLSLEHNRLKYIHEDAFSWVPKLESLIVSSNNLATFPENTYQNLKILSITDNIKLLNFPDDKYFNKIEVLKLQYAYHCCPFMKFSKPAEVNAVIYDDIQYIDRDSLKNSSNFYDLVGDMSYNEEQIIPLINYGELMKPRSVICTPLPNPFSPCENLLGDPWLRLSVWLISTMGILCNVMTIIFNIIDGIYLYHTNMVVNVPVFLLTNLAISDLSMAIYLVLIAIKDATTRGIFDRVALSWQYSFSCNLAGFLSISSFLFSAFLLTFITFERYYAIKNSIDFNKRIKFKTALKVILVLWMMSIAVALMPLNNINSYSVYAICLPLDTSTMKAKAYVSLLVLVLFTCFISICVCYVLIFLTTVTLERRSSSTSSCNSDKQVKQRSFEDQRLARNISLLILANMISWGPAVIVCICGMISKNGINRFWFKILAVFIMPLSSLINPILYCLSRRRFRLYLFRFLLRTGIKKNSFDQPSITLSITNTSH